MKGLKELSKQNKGKVRGACRLQNAQCAPRSEKAAKAAGAPADPIADRTVT